jgi:hypothetical protein
VNGFKNGYDLVNSFDYTIPTIEIGDGQRNKTTQSSSIPKRFDQEDQSKKGSCLASSFQSDFSINSSGGLNSLNFKTIDDAKISVIRISNNGCHKK